MEETWQRHEIKILDQELTFDSYLKFSNEGLETNAEKLHQKFVSSQQHLNDVRKFHMEIMSEPLTNIQQELDRRMDIYSTHDMLREFKGEINDLGISLPMKINSPNDILFHSRIENETQIVQIVSSNINGGIFRSFALPEGNEIKQIVSNNGIIEILFR